MPQEKTGVATTIMMPEPSGAAFVEISPNKTLFIQKLTNEDPRVPEIKQGLTKVEDVFEYFKPVVEVELDKENGATIKETFKFGSLGDFDTRSLINQSSFLQNLSLENDAFLKIIKQLRSNTALQKVIADPETKKAFINSLVALVSELEKSDS